MNKAYLLEKLGNEIQHALHDHNVNEITLNPDGKLWFMHSSKGWVAGETMPSHLAYVFVHAYAQYENQYLNEHKPYLDGTLPFNGERINITISPLHKGVAFNIRKMARKIYTLQDYVEQGVMTVLQSNLLKQAIKDRKNILVSGGPGTGKTTLTNALLDEVAVISPVGHRILILEQVPELQCRVLNCKPMVTNDKQSMRTLLWIAMRNSPDRIVIGEVRDGAALEMLKAWNTGCSSGAIATIHANSPQAAVQRVLDLSLEVTSFPPHTLAAESLNVIVQLEARPDLTAGRCVSGIISVEGFNRMTNEFIFKDMETSYEVD